MMGYGIKNPSESNSIHRKSDNFNDMTSNNQLSKSPRNINNIINLDGEFVDTNYPNICNSIYLNNLVNDGPEEIESIDISDLNFDSRRSSTKYKCNSIALISIDENILLEKEFSEMEIGTGISFRKEENLVQDCNEDEPCSQIDCDIKSNNINVKQKQIYEKHFKINNLSEILSDSVLRDDSKQNNSSYFRKQLENKVTNILNTFIKNTSDKIIQKFCEIKLNHLRPLIDNKLEKQSNVPSTEIDEIKEVEQVKLKCSKCNNEINGIRYSCPECSNYNLCGACEENENHSHRLNKFK